MGNAKNNMAGAEGDGHGTPQDSQMAGFRVSGSRDAIKQAVRRICVQSGGTKTLCSDRVCHLGQL